MEEAGEEKKQKWKIIGRHGGKSMGWVTAPLNRVGDSELAFPHVQVVGSLVMQWTLRESQGRSAGQSSPPCRGRAQATERPGLGLGFGQLTLSSAKLIVPHAVGKY